MVRYILNFKCGGKNIRGVDTVEDTLVLAPKTQ